MGKEGISTLARALESNASLTTLNLSGNNMGTEGAASLARTLESNTSLTTLPLSQNNIGAEGAARGPWRGIHR